MIKFLIVVALIIGGLKGANYAMESVVGGVITNLNTKIAGNADTAFTKAVQQGAGMMLDSAMASVK